MSYKYSTGSVRKGDIYFEDDREGEPTYIDFGQDSITLRPSGSQILYANATAVGIGTTTPTEVLTLNATDPTILFEENGTDKATIGVNSSDNILIENKTINKHIVFKVNDQGVVREGFRLDGAVPEVVVNQTSDSLVDFRVESNNQTHMLFVDGSADSFGVNVSNPTRSLEVDGDSHFSGSVSFPDIMMTELSIPGVDVQTDTNAYRFNCPYNLTVASLVLNLDQHTTSGDVTVTVTNSTSSDTMITLSITGTGLSANTTTVSNAAAAQGDTITFAITATPANAQGLRAVLGFRRDL